MKIFIQPLDSKGVEFMGFADVKQKADAIQKAVEESSHLIGKPGAGQVPGVTVPVGLDGMGTYSKSLQVLGDSLKQSIFKVLFMGTFKNGKSTTLNALLGKLLLPEGATEKTAVIAQVVHGADDGLVRVFKNGSPNPETVSYQAFEQQYQLTRNDKRLVDREGGSIDDRFSSIDYVLLKNPSELLKNGVQLIDSPGLAATRSREKVTQNYFRQANAIVFLLDATHPFSAEERVFIAQHFVNVEPKPRNVFFPVNRINQVNGETGRRDVISKTQRYFKNVFTKNGVFDSDFYNKRVFFVDSLGRYNEKCDGTTSDEFGIKEFRRFEKELEAFLVSDERTLAPYRTAAANLAAVYLEAQRQIEQHNQLMQKSLNELKNNQLESEKKLAELEKAIERMEETIDNTKNLVAKKLIGDLQKFLGTDILEKWPSHAETFDRNLSILDMITLANPLSSNKRKQAVFQPLISFVQEFVEQQLLDLAENSPSLIQKDLDDLREKLESQTEEFSINLAKIHETFIHGKDGVTLINYYDIGKANPFQLLFSLIQGDISVAVENAGGGNFTWGEFAKKYIFQGIINAVLFSVVGFGPIGIAAWIIVEGTQLRIGANERTLDTLNKLAAKAFEDVAREMGQHGNNIETTVNEQFDILKDKVTETARGLIEDERSAQKKIVADRAKTESETATESLRLNTIKDELRKRTALAYEALYDKEPTDDAIKRLAASVTVAQRESA